MANIMKCKWAGDPEDTYCKDCNGCEIMVDGVSHPATACKGYETEEEQIEQVQEPVEEDVNNLNIATTNGNISNSNENEKDNKIYTKEENSLKNENTQPRGYSSELRFMSGGSVERNGVWYKFECSETRVLEPNLSEEQVAEEREKLWATVNSEIDKQLEDILKL